MISISIDAALNTVRALGHDTQAFSLYMVARARLGLAAELQEALNNWPGRLQLFPQGFFHYFGRGNPQFADHDSRLLKEIRVVGSQGETIHWPMAVSNQMSIEGGPVLQLAVNEMLLQSYTGNIRVFPAVTEDWVGQFRLHAVGRFVVSAARAEGKTIYVVIESRGGETCCVVNPWPGLPVVLYQRDSDWSRITTLHTELLSFPTQSGGLYLLLPQGIEPGILKPTSFSASPNQQHKTLGTARLGMPKGF